MVLSRVRTSGDESGDARGERSRDREFWGIARPGVRLYLGPASPLASPLSALSKYTLQEHPTLRGRVG
eukprot:4496930-Prymnesium_polylepis.1